MDVKALTAALEEALERFRNSTADENFGPGFPTELQDAIFEREFSKGVLRVLEEQEEFADGKALMVNSLDGRLGFQSQFAVLLLMRQARRRMSAEAAVSWLEKVLGTKSAEGIVVYTLWGVDPGKPVKLLDDIDLLPFDSLPDSRQKGGLTSPQWLYPALSTPMYAWEPPAAALVAQVKIAPFLVDINDAPAPAQNAYRTRFEDIRLCLATNGPAIIIPGPSWFQFLDSDLEAALIGASQNLNHQEIVPIHVPINKTWDASAAPELVKAYLELASTPALKNRVHTAMERLHQALVRRSPADKALELAIALETLLVNSQGEHTFKIALRAALLTAENLEERSRNRAIIEAVYGMRSALMHSGQAPTECKLRGYGKKPSVEVAAEAATITSLIIRRVLAERQLPDWNSLELSIGMQQGTKDVV
jgi:Apea-like HEPN